MPTYWLNGRWFLQIADIGTVGIYIQYILYSLVLIFFISNVGGGGGVNVFPHFILFPTFPEKKIL